MCHSEHSQIDVHVQVTIATRLCLTKSFIGSDVKQGHCPLTQQKIHVDDPRMQSEGCSTVQAYYYYKAHVMCLKGVHVVLLLNPCFE